MKMLLGSSGSAHPVLPPRALPWAPRCTRRHQPSSPRPSTPFFPRPCHFSCDALQPAYNLSAKLLWKQLCNPGSKDRVLKNSRGAAPTTFPGQDGRSAGAPPPLGAQPAGGRGQDPDRRLLPSCCSTVGKAPHAGNSLPFAQKSG